MMSHLFVKAIIIPAQIAMVVRGYTAIRQPCARLLAHRILVNGSRRQIDCLPSARKKTGKVHPFVTTRLFGTHAPNTAVEADSSSESLQRFSGTVTILEQGDQHLVVAKPASVLCHHSDWAGSRSKKRAPQIPMLQRVREALQGRRVNVIHRLDRGCSGCLLFAYAQNNNDNDEDHENAVVSCKNATAVLSEAMTLKSTVKTYVALVRGEGILHDRDFKQEGWFEVTRPIKNEKGVIQNATTFFRFVAGQASTSSPEGVIDQPRASLVLARPLTGRWHQIRRHLNGLSHPILGDSSHGNSKVNREWKERGMPPERTCLHLARLQMEPTPACPSGIDVSCPLPSDMLDMLTTHLPGVLKEAQQILQEEGITLNVKEAEELPYEVFLPPR